MARCLILTIIKVPNPITYPSPEVGVRHLAGCFIWDCLFLLQKTYIISHLIRAWNRQLCSPPRLPPYLSSRPHQPPFLLGSFSCFFSSGFFHNPISWWDHLQGQIWRQRERGVELEVGLQCLSSQSQSTGPFLGTTRRSRDVGRKDVENYSKWPTFNLNSVGRIR